MSGSTSVRGETLTATERAVPAALQRAHSPSASDRTRPSSWKPSPYCSARGTNSTGGTDPSRGWCQRTRASTTSQRPAVSSTVGW